MSHGQPPHTQSIVPCQCGSTEVYWHRPTEGVSVYECDPCWARNPANPDRGKRELARLFALRRRLDDLNFSNADPRWTVTECDDCHTDYQPVIEIDEADGWQVCRPCLTTRRANLARKIQIAGRAALAAGAPRAVVGTGF